MAIITGKKVEQSIFKKDTVLFAFLWCAVHPRQCSSNATEQLLKKVRRISQLNTSEEAFYKGCLLLGVGDPNQIVHQRLSNSEAIYYDKVNFD